MSVTADPTFWDKLAEKYARQPVANPSAFERKIALTLARIKPEDVVLDIGCGTGSLALRLASSGAQIHGLDLSREMIRIAQRKASEQAVSKVRFHTGPFDESFQAFEPGTLDGICAYSILHLVDDRADALARIYRLLKPGGFFISSTVSLGESWVPYRPILSVMRWLKKAPKVSIFTKRRLRAEIADAGFIELSEPDVGADATIAFLIATKPR